MAVFSLRTEKPSRRLTDAGSLTSVLPDDRSLLCLVRFDPDVGAGYGLSSSSLSAGFHLTMKGFAMLHDALNLNTAELAGGLNRANEQLARARAQAEIQNAMQSPDGIREQITRAAADPASVTAQIKQSVLDGRIGVMPRLFIIAIACLFSLASTAAAQCPRCGRFHPPYDRQPVRNTLQAAGGFVRNIIDGSPNALDEVNAKRARMGLRPFLEDPSLTQGAFAVASYRAQYRIKGHVTRGRTDFSFLPAGASARAAGCGAMEDSWGWNTCCMEENWTYAGAAWVRGADGQRYMHLFVR